MLNFIEKQNLYQIEIPVGATFRFDNIVAGNDLYLGMGLKLGVPVSSKYKLKSGQYKVSGYTIMLSPGLIPKLNVQP